MEHDPSRRWRLRGHGSLLPLHAVCLDLGRGVPHRQRRRGLDPAAPQVASASCAGSGRFRQARCRAGDRGGGTDGRGNSSDPPTAGTHGARSSKGSNRGASSNGGVGRRGRSTGSLDPVRHRQDLVGHGGRVGGARAQSTDEGATWTIVYPEEWAGTWVSDFNVDPHDSLERLRAGSKIARHRDPLGLPFARRRNHLGGRPDSGASQGGCQAAVDEGYPRPAGPILRGLCASFSVGGVSRTV